MTSACIASVIVTHIAAMALLVVALATSHWVRIGRINRTGLCACSECDCGVWYFCSRGRHGSEGEHSDCTFFIANESRAEMQLPDKLFAPLRSGCHRPKRNVADYWFKAAQATLALAAALSVTSLVLELAAVCLLKNLHHIIIVTSVLSAFLLTVAVSIFGTEVSHLDDIALTIEGLDDKSHLAWSYWVAVAAAGLAWLATSCSLIVCWHRCSPLYSV